MFCAAAILMSLMLSFIAFLGQQKIEKQYSQLLTQFNKLSSAFQQIESSYIGLGHRVNELEGQVDQYIDLIKQQEVGDARLSTYNHAAKMVELGANVDDVISTCGLTQAEAELVVLINKKGNQNKQTSPVGTENVANGSDNFDTSL